MDAATENITCDIAEQARLTPEEAALVLPERDVSYRLLDAYVWRAAAYLDSRGVRPGDIVGIRTDDQLFSVIFLLGVMRIGATFAPIPRSVTAFQVNSLFVDIKPNLLLTSTPEKPDLGIKTVCTSIGELNGYKSVAEKILCRQPSAPCLIFSGSGSTGRPKTISLNHRQIRQRCGLAFCTEHEGEALRVLSLTNLEFPSGINRLLSTLLRGGAYFLHNASANSVLKLCQEKSVSTLFASVFHTEVILSCSTDLRKPALPDLKHFRLSGSSVSLELRSRIRDSLSPNLQIVYGTNECGRISMAKPPRIYHDHHDVGLPLPGVEVKIVDDSGKPLGCNQRGQILLRTPSMINAYINNPVATADHFSGGWFNSGDIGEMTSEGTIRHFGRKDSMMIFNGINIYPVEIEQALKDMPGIKDAAVFPFHHPVHQDVPIGVVELDGNVSYKGDSLKDALRERIGFKTPHTIYVVEKIPRNANGKLQIDAIRSAIQSSVQNTLA